MIHEHALTYKEKPTIRDIEYLVNKANRLGKNGRDIIRAYQQEDEEGFHVYFEVTGMSDG